MSLDVFSVCTIPFFVGKNGQNYRKNCKKGNIFLKATSGDIFVFEYVAEREILIKALYSISIFWLLGGAKSARIWY